MATASQLYTSLDTYLHTSYSPDCDWIAGELKERRLGQFEHANLQKVLILVLSRHEEELNVRVLPEQRVKVAADRYRVPDIVVLPRANREAVVTHPPLICIEILSPDDTVCDLQDRLLDYASMGVPNIWIFDPIKQRVWTLGEQGSWIAVSPDAALGSGDLRFTPAG